MNAKQLLAGLALLAAASTASAYVQCSVTPAAVYVDNGSIWVNWKEGGAGSALLSDGATKYYYSAILTAIAAGKGMIVRYSDGVSCTSHPGTIIGLWING